MVIYEESLNFIWVNLISNEKSLLSIIAAFSHPKGGGFANQLRMEHQSVYWENELSRVC
ncbi:hypothetical protein VIBNISFn118_1820001 [Vibrio nigripulchritudo SFn118]|nr:hypothetical protein VIBNISFn118_1820001 [Vibrio nigripulchritudo SFn118]